MLSAGQTINGRYVLQSPIGEGAMGAVWRAEDKTLRRQIAIKFLFVRGTRDPQAMIDQFLREARIAASIQHRNVIQTVDFGTVDEYQPFMVMELLSGESFSDRLAREPKLTTEQLIHILSLTLRGLAAVHDAGIVHRDLKPQNVFLQRDADAVYPKILDFGISRSLDGGGERPSAIATQEGLIVGTPDYMSPEQARGEANIDRRSDIYSMGVMLYEGLTGRLPFETDTVGDLIVQIVTQEPPRIRELVPAIPEALSDMVAQSMAKNREYRFSDARAMRRALLSATESNLPAGRRSAYSIPPTGANAPINVPMAPAALVDAQSSTWGDFEGLSGQRSAVAKALAAAPEKSLQSPAESAQPRATAPTPFELLPVGAAGGGAPAPPREPATARDRATPDRATPERGPGGGKRKQSATRGAEPALEDGLDPLYAGANDSPIDIDYAHGQKRVRKAAPVQAARGNTGMRVPRQADPDPSAWKWVPWLLAVAVLLLVGYMVQPKLAPGLVSSPPAADGVSGTLRSSASVVSHAGAGQAPGEQIPKGRRPNPGNAPVHMRDVVF